MSTLPLKKKRSLRHRVRLQNERGHADMIIPVFSKTPTLVEYEERFDKLNHLKSIPR